MLPTKPKASLQPDIKLSTLVRGLGLRIYCYLFKNHHKTKACHPHITLARKHLQFFGSFLLGHVVEGAEMQEPGP